MSLIELKTDPSRKDLVWFGLLLPVAAALAGVLVWRSSEDLRVARYIWGAGALLTLIYYAVPRVQRPVFVGWMYAAYPIGWTLSHVLLLLIFFGVITPIGLLMRALGHDPMNRRAGRAGASAWRARGRTAVDRRRYFQQF